MSSLTLKSLVLASCLLVLHVSSCRALLLGSFIGCNSFGCRISNLESDVAQLKQQVARLDPSGSMNNFPRPNPMQPFNPNNNMNNMNQQQQQQQQMNNNGQQANNGQNGNQNAQPNQRQGDDGRVSYSLDYPVINGGQTLRRNSNYQLGGGQLGNGQLNNGQFINML